MADRRAGVILAAGVPEDGGIVPANASRLCGPASVLETVAHMAPAITSSVAWRTGFAEMRGRSIFIFA